MKPPIQFFHFFFNIKEEYDGAFFPTNIKCVFDRARLWPYGAGKTLYPVFFASPEDPSTLLSLEELEKLLQKTLEEMRSNLLWEDVQIIGDGYVDTAYDCENDARCGS